ncbi:hypothetical protein, partial [Azonexus sp.]|uniref:hypothetical protein n=1 Tax=Azonexus sp. TaxID=1872668 RepID=UPI0035AEE0F4
MSSRMLKGGFGSRALLLILACWPGLSQAATQSRTAVFEYDATTGLLVREVVEPGNPDLCVATVHSYDAYGNRTASTTR